MSSTELVRYEAARRALAESSRVDEIKPIRDKAMAMQLYALQAKDRELIDHATEIRFRAEIRAGELLKEMDKAKGATKKGRGKGGNAVAPRDRVVEPTLSDIGVSKTQSSRWQKLAALPQEKQEEKIEAAKSKAQAAIDPPPKTIGKKPAQNKAPKRADKKSDQAPPLVGSSIDPHETCLMRVRALILDEWLSQIPLSKLAQFVADLRDEIDDIILVVEKRKIQNGHHAARQSA